MMKPNSESDYQSSYPCPALLVESGVAWLAFKNCSATVLLENLAAMADFVLEAAVVGVPDPVWGEKAMAIITRVPAASKTEEDLIEFLKTVGVDKGKITKWMLPKLVAIVDTVPKTSVGKYDKRAIKRNLKEYLAKAKEIKSR
ncbi:MAG: hypothetical protein NWS07_01075 [Desulfobacterales bacterium]|nr:hypothetical protein [Desulfobacterales bacterium]